MKVSWTVLILAAVCIGVLGAGCSSGGGTGTDNGCCAACSPPPGVCPGDAIFDGGVGDAFQPSSDAGSTSDTDSSACTVPTTATTLERRSVRFLGSFRAVA